MSAAVGVRSQSEFKTGLPVNERNSVNQLSLLSHRIALAEETIVKKSNPGTLTWVVDVLSVKVATHSIMEFWFLYKPLARHKCCTTDDRNGFPANSSIILLSYKVKFLSSCNLSKKCIRHREIKHQDLQIVYHLLVTSKNLKKWFLLDHRMCCDGQDVDSWLLTFLQFPVGNVCWLMIFRMILF